MHACHYMYLIFSCSSASFTISLAPARSWSWRIYNEWVDKVNREELLDVSVTCSLPLIWKWQCDTDSQIKSLLIGSSRFTTKKRWNYWPCCYWLQNLFYFQIVAISYFVCTCILSMAVLHCLLFPQYLVVVANDFRNTYHGKLKSKCQKSWTKLYRVTQRLV